MISKVQISEIAEIGAGQGAPQDPNAFSNEGYPFIRAGSLEGLCSGKRLNSLEKVKPEDADRYRLKLYPPGTVVFAKSGMSAMQNRVYELPAPAYVVSHLATLQVKWQLNPTYLRYFWKSYQPSRLIQDPAYPSISLEAIAGVEIELPPIESQKRIAAILEKADRLRRLRRYAQQMSETYLQSVFVRMFGDPITNPMMWPQTKIADLAIFITSGSRGWAEHYASEGARFIRVQNLTGNQLDLANTAYVSPPPTAETKRTMIQPDDLLLAITGATIGLCALAPSNIGEAYVNQHVAILRFKKEVIPTYLAAFMAHGRGGQYQIARMQYGDTKPGLSLEQIRSIEVPFPPPEIQKKFAQICRRYERLRFQQREAERQAEHLFQTLLHRAFRGEL